MIGNVIEPNGAKISWREAFLRSKAVENTVFNVLSDWVESPEEEELLEQLLCLCFVKGDTSMMVLDAEVAMGKAPDPKRASAQAGGGVAGDGDGASPSPDSFKLSVRRTVRMLRGFGRLSLPTELKLKIGLMIGSFKDWSYVLQHEANINLHVQKVTPANVEQLLESLTRWSTHSQARETMTMIVRKGMDAKGIQQVKQVLQDTAKVALKRREALKATLAEKRQALQRARAQEGGVLGELRRSIASLKAVTKETTKYTFIIIIVLCFGFDFWFLASFHCFASVGRSGACIQAESRSCQAGRCREEVLQLHGSRRLCCGIHRWLIIS